MANFPNGFFIDGLLWWGETLQRDVWISKGFYITPPDLSEASTSQKNSFKTMLMAFHAALGDEVHAQWHWSVTNDYYDALQRYDETTERLAHNATKWCRFVRKDRYNRAMEAMEKHELRREKLRVFLSRKIDARLPIRSVGRASQRQYIDRLVEQEKKSFETYLSTMRALFDNTVIEPMSDEDHFQALRRYANPSLAEGGKAEEVAHEMDAAMTIQENVWRGDIGRHPECSFRMDDTFQNIIVVTRLPKVTYPGVYRSLTSLGFHTYDVVLNIHPLSIRKEMEKEEDLIRRLEGDFHSEKKYSLLQALKKKERKVEALAEGYTLPYNVLMLVRVWDSSLDGLVAKTNAVKNAITAMSGAQYYETSMFTPAKHLFFQTWPGWLGGKYTYKNIYAEHEWLADMIPFSSTFTGDLDEAEALYDGAQGNIVGVRLFQNQTPQHGAMFGMTGSGKSVNMTDLLSQTSLFYDYTVLVEEGLTYGVYTATEGCRPIVLKADGDLTINYFDTGGTPLTALQMSTASALAMRIVGTTGERSHDQHRAAMLGEYVKQIYEDYAREWLKKDEERAWLATAGAFAIEQWRRAKMPKDSTYLDAFCEFRDLASSDHDQAYDWFHKWDRGEIVKWAKTPDGDYMVVQQAFSSFEPEEFPQHEGLVEMMLHGAMKHHDRAEVNFMASALQAWVAAGGMYGRLLDGVTNVDLKGRVAHFELGQIPESANELKSVAGFLITNVARQHIVTLPRNVRKRMVFEEAARFMDVPGGEKILSENFAQLRKFKCVSMAIVQQYAQFQASAIRPVVMANSKVFFLMRQNDRQDVEEIGRDIGLTDSTKEAIRTYPLPEVQAPGERFSSYTYVTQQRAGQVSGTVRNYSSPEMLYCSSSDGDVFEQRAKALLNYPDVCEGIFGEVDKAAEERERQKKQEVKEAQASREKRARYLIKIGG